MTFVLMVANERLLCSSTVEKRIEWCNSEWGIFLQEIIVQEYGMCNYEMVFETPFACVVEEKEQLANLLRYIFKQDFDFDKNEFIVQWD